MPRGNAIYTQSGGVTSVINATACGVIRTARVNRQKIDRVYAGHNGILGVLREDLVDTGQEREADVDALRFTPGGAFGSCRYKLPDPDPDHPEYRRLLEVFKAHEVRFFFCNGGGDSQDTAWKVSQVCARADYPLVSIGIPKTVDNDLQCTDTCPGFGSVAKYVATSVRETSLDLVSMCASSTKVFILEVMGRHAGWIAAAGGLAATRADELPQVILFPEIPFDQQRFLECVSANVTQHGYCVVVASEGTRYADGRFLFQVDDSRDAFGHAQFGGVAAVLAAMIRDMLEFKCHWAVADYLQRSARHIASATDVEQAYAVGRAAVEMSLSGLSGVMVSIVREPGPEYRWTLGHVPLAQVANRERKLPSAYISSDGFGITDAARSYLLPLIQGEEPPPYRGGLPAYVQLKKHRVKPRLSAFPG